MVIQLNNKTSDAEAFALKVLTSNAVDAANRTEMAHKTAFGLRLDRLAEDYWAGRHPADRKSARYAA